MVYGVRTLGGSKIWAALAAAPLAAGAVSLAVALASAGGSPAPGAVPAAGDSPQAAARAGESYGRLPMRFEANRGQTDSRVRFLNRGPGYTLFLTPREAVLSLTKRAPSSAGATPGGQVAAGKTAGAVVRMKMLGANPNPKLAGLAQLPGAANYLTGKDRRDWKTGVPSYRRVRYESVYPGTDLVYYGRQGRLEYDFALEPGADPRAIALKFDGARELSLTRSGDLVLHTAAGRLRQRRPVVYQTVGGARQPVPGRYVLKGGGRVGFAVGRFDRSRPLVIDPVLTYSTYLGGASAEGTRGIAVDSSGAAYVTGRTSSIDFPTTAGAFQRTRGGGTPFSNDVFVAKLNPTGSALAYSTYIGGAQSEEARGIAVDSSGRAFVTGMLPATATDFPTTTNALRTTPVGGGDAFLSVLKGDGSGLDYSTFLGGSTSDNGFGVAVSSTGKAYVVGRTSSANFPTAGTPYQPAAGGGFDAFVSQIDPAASGTASLVASTFLGGSGTEQGLGIALDASGAYVTGSTGSANFPTQGPFQAALKGSTDVFVTKLTPALSSLAYSTYLGGSSATERGNGIALDSSGSAYVVGTTGSTDFPTANAFQGSLGGNPVAALEDAFVTKLSAAGSALVYSTYLGGSLSDTGFAIAVDGSGGAFVSGQAGSEDFPSVKPLAPRGDGSDAFVARVAPAGGALTLSSYLGGGSEEFPETPVAATAAGDAYVAGTTASDNFPTLSPLQADAAGGGAVDAQDAFVAKISPDASGAPLVTGLEPRSGPAGTSVAISGSGFTGASVVRFGGVVAAGFRVDSDTRITAVRPTSTERTAAVTVSKAGSSSPPNPIARFVDGEGAWSLTGSLVTARSQGRSPTATLLRNGKVLAAGGLSPGGTFPSAGELYDPVTGRWTLTGPMQVPREDHTATLLGTGEVLVVGGGGATAKTAELYDPETNGWRATGALSLGRTQHTATLLANGKVLVAGGAVSISPPTTATAEIYDPATGGWTSAPAMTTPRKEHTATRLSGPACAGSAPPSYCGKVLVVSGRVDNNSQSQPTSSTELYDPATNSWAPTGQLLGGRTDQTMTTLRNGTVLVAGGLVGGRATASAELYDPAAGSWGQVGAMGTPRNTHAAAVLGNGDVLVMGGATNASNLNSSELYDPATRSWRSAGLLTAYRTPGPAPGFAVLLSSSTASFAADRAVCGANCGKVLVGGAGGVFMGSAEKTTELYTPRPAGAGPGSGGGGGAGGYPLPYAGPVAPFGDCPAQTANVIRGTAASQSISGTPRGDRIFALAGNDTVDGRAGNDCIDLGPGTDRGQGGSGADLIVGGLGRDRISGGSGNDRLRGGASPDRVIGGSGNDRLHGQSGSDRISGERGRDRISGGSSNDRVSGGSSGDRIVGNQGNDRIDGNSGNDVISGNSGRDRLKGSAGRDRLSGGSGNDRIDARDGLRDRISCGRGRDTVSADRIDRVARDCERVSRARPRSRRSARTAAGGALNGPFGAARGAVRGVRPSPW